jgi:hypothetical protein
MRKLSTKGAVAMQAIVTKYLGATNYRSARVKATCQGGSNTLVWDDALDVDGNHDKAAFFLARKLGWVDNHAQDNYRHCYQNGGRKTVLHSGGMPGGEGNCYVLVSVDKF